MDEKDLGKRLQQMRREANLTQQQLCAAADLSYSTLAKIERGAIKAPSIFTIQSIANALSVSLDELLGRTPIKKTVALVPDSKQVSKTGIKFIYFDLNGCLIRFISRAFTALAQESGQSVDVVESIFWKYDNQVCRGEISLDELNTVWAERLGIMVDWKKYYFGAVEAMPGMQKLVEWTAKHYQVGILSNTMPGFIPSLRERKLIPNVQYNAIIDSSIVHALKPEKAMYETAQVQAGVQPHEILFIDDTRANLIMAENLGWRTIWFDQFEIEATIKAVQSALEL